MSLESDNQMVFISIYFIPSDFAVYWTNATEQPCPNQFFVACARAFSVSSARCFSECLYAFLPLAPRFVSIFYIFGRCSILNSNTNSITTTTITTRENGNIVVAWAVISKWLFRITYYRYFGAFFVRVLGHYKVKESALRHGEWEFELSMYRRDIPNGSIAYFKKSATKSKQRANKSIGNWKKGNGRERKEFIYMYIIWMKIERAHLFIFLWQKHHHFQF